MTTIDAEKIRELRAKAQYRLDLAAAGADDDCYALGDFRAAATPETVLALLSALEEARAAMKWVDQLNPSTNYESDGAIVHITFDEFDRMRACLGIRPAHRGKEKAMTVSRRWFRETTAKLSTALAERDEARRELTHAQQQWEGCIGRGVAHEQEIERLKREVWLLTNGAEGTWRCFQCDQVFTNRREAQRHFGHWPADKPLCVHEHAGDEAYWRDKYTAADEYNEKIRQADFKRWSEEKARAEQAEAENKRLISVLEPIVDEFSCTIEQYYKIGPDFTHKDGTEVFTVQTVLDREPLITAARAALKGASNAE